MGNIITVNFHGNQLIGFEDAGGVSVALKPIVEGMGLAWNKQLERVKRDPILSEGMTIMVIPSEGGAQESTCLRLDLVHGWLFTVDSARVKPEIRERVLVYQRECYRVLARAFARPDAQAEPAPVPIDTVQWEPARKLVAETRHLFGDLAGRQLWFKLGLPTVPAMYGQPAQLPLFTYDAHPHQGGRS